jgi:hypothetical protein
MEGERRGWTAARHSRKEREGDGRLGGLTGGRAGAWATPIAAM